MPISGCIISFEGIDGAGKSTQAKRLAHYLSERGCPSVRFTALQADPALTEISKRLLQASPPDHAAVQMFFAFCRLQQAREVERHRTEGKVVIYDRYKHSSLVYGIAAGLDETWSRSLERLLPDPAIVLLLDIDANLGAGRSGRTDELEADHEMQKRCTALYRQLRTEHAATWHRIDGGLTEDEVFDQIATVVHPYIEARVPHHEG